MKDFIGCVLIGMFLAGFAAVAYDRHEELPEPASVREAREAFEAVKRADLLMEPVRRHERDATFLNWYDQQAALRTTGRDYQHVRFLPAEPPYDTF